MKHQTRFGVAALVAVWIFGGCPGGFDPAAAPAISSPDEQANRDFTRARVLFTAGSMSQADEAFARFLTRYPADPLAALAQVYRGRVALERRQLKRARDLLRGPAGGAADEGVRLQARYQLGLVQVRLGSHAEGRRLLTPFLQRVQPEQLPELLWGLARAAGGLGDYAAAARYLARWHAATDRPAERAYCRGRLEQIIDGPLQKSQLEGLHRQAPAGSLLAALTGRRLAGLAASAGQTETADRLRRESAAAMAAHGVAPAGSGGPVNPGLVGLLAPLAGRYQAAGRQLMAGAMAGARVFDSAAAHPGLALAVRDSSQGPAAAARELIEARGVVALAGTLNPSASAAVAAVAASHQVPFISLAAPSGAPAGTSFHVLPRNAARAAALARHAVKVRKLRTVAILAPRTPYGDRMAAAMARAVTAAGGKLVARLAYPPRTTSFSALAEQLAKKRFAALFVPDTARALALIAPALVRAGLWPTARVRSEKPGQRTILLLATADGLSPRTLGRAARYLEGAVLAPGYCPTPDPAGLAARLQQAHGHPPTLLEAFAHDTIHLLRRHLQSGAATPQQLLQSLRTRPAPSGLTGPLRFQPGGQRATPPRLYRVANGACQTVSDTPI